MKKEFLTPQGKVKIEITQDEIKKYALIGDDEAKKEILKQELAAAKDITERITAIIKFLGV